MSKKEHTRVWASVLKAVAPIVDEGRFFSQQQGDGEVRCRALALYVPPHQAKGAVVLRNNVVCAVGSCPEIESLVCGVQQQHTSSRSVRDQSGDDVSEPSVMKSAHGVPDCVAARMPLSPLSLVFQDSLAFKGQANAI